MCLLQQKKARPNKPHRFDNLELMFATDRLPKDCSLVKIVGGWDGRRELTQNI